MGVSGWAQTSTSAVRGSVRDATGAMIAAAEVKLINTVTNTVGRTVTNEVGFYVFPALHPGPYLLSASAAGMQPFEGKLMLQAQQDATIDISLQVGQTATTLLVQDVTPITVVDNPTLGHVLEQRRIQDLPINGRDITNLLTTVPGMEGLRSFGMRQNAYDFVVDGASIQSRDRMGIVTRPPGLDTVQEFKVENHGSSAKFSRPTTVMLSTKSGTNAFHGALFETLRNNAILTARAREDFYTKAPQLNRNEFGASAGGPVYIPKVYDGRNRTFWFFGYEGFRNVNPQTKGFSVPTEAMRNGDFSGRDDALGRRINIYDPATTDPKTWQRQQFAYGSRANVIDPARISPLAKYLYSITPLPTLPDVNPLLDNNWWGLVPNRTSQNTLTARIDHSFSERDRVYGRYTHGTNMNHAPYKSLPMLDGVVNTAETAGGNQSLATDWTHTFSPTLFNEFSASISRQVQWLNTGGKNPKNYADMLGLPNPLGASGWPYALDTGLGNLSYQSQWNTNSAQTYTVLDDNFTKVHGRHEFQFGGRFRFDELNDLPGQWFAQGNNSFATQATALYDPKSLRTNPQPLPQTGSNLANMFLGVMNYKVQLNRSYYYMRSKELAGYVQDNFKISPRLTLNLGLRYEYWPALREKNSMMVGFDRERHAIVLGADLDTMYRMGATVPSAVKRLQGLGASFISYKDAGLPQSLIYTNKTNFAPRLGFAYRMGPENRQFVLRGGYSISYFPMQISAMIYPMQTNVPFTVPFQYSVTSAALSPDGIANYGLRSVPQYIAGVNSRNAISLADASSLARGSSLSYFDPHQPESRAQDWNLTLEHGFLRNMVARVSYVGNHGSRMEQMWKYNTLPTDYVWYTRTGQPLPTGEYAPVARRPYDQQVYADLGAMRKTGWSNYNGITMEMERRFSNGIGFQIFYSEGNAMSSGQDDGGNGWGVMSNVPEAGSFLSGTVPTDPNALNRFMNYQRDTTVPKHRLRWNWIADLPFGSGKAIGGHVGSKLNRIIGGWQMAGMGQLRSTYFALPDTQFPNGNPIETYGYKYPVQDCRSGACTPGYLWWNGYIPANRINSYDATGKPNGVMGVPANYRPAGQPINVTPANPDRNDPMFQYYGSNTVWVPLNTGTLQRTTYDTGAAPWQNQYLPGVRRWGLDASLFKVIPITERVRVRFNADFFNVLNMPGNPNSIGGDGILNARTSGVAPRVVQLTLRVLW